MAKVTGPLLSLSASGTVANTMTFSIWKGRAYVRNRVVPSNPKTEGQESARNAVRSAGAGQHWSALTAMVGPSRTETDKSLLTVAAPSGQAWNGFLVQQIVGKGGLNFVAANTAYGLLDQTAQTAWETAAQALVPAMPAVTQTSEGGVTATALSDGNVWFDYQYGLAQALGYTTPGAVPPAYA